MLEGIITTTTIIVITNTNDINDINNINNINDINIHNNNKKQMQGRSRECFRRGGANLFVWLSGSLDE